MATITPPSMERIGDAPSQPLAREMIFVIDNSGSMAGESMRTARQSLTYALDTLRSQDRFNIIRFDDTMTELHRTAVPANQFNLERARAFTNDLEAEGGTEMLPALRAALDPFRCEASNAVGAAACEVAGEAETLAMQQDGTVRQIIFLTDGALSNLSLIHI